MTITTHATKSTTSSSPTAPMSTEQVIAKKRGRPRKSPLPESAATASPAPAKPVTARKSAPKASPTDPAKPRTRKAKSQTTEAAPAPKSTASPISAQTTAAAASPVPSPIPESEDSPNQTTSIPPPPWPSSTPTHRPSKILTAVRELSTKASPASKPSSSTKPVSHPRTPSKTSHPKPPPKTAATTPPPKSTPHNAAPPPKPPAPKPPLGALNSKIVSDLSTPSGARPSARNTQLPPNYKPVARKVTMIIVALPIAIVTSYVLWQRLVMGEEQKVLSRAPKAEAEAEAKGKRPELG